MKKEMSTDFSSDDCEFAPESDDESYESKNTKLTEELGKDGYHKHFNKSCRVLWYK